jgi:hypothetical protein
MTQRQHRRRDRGHGQGERRRALTLRVLVGDVNPYRGGRAPNQNAVRSARCVWSPPPSAIAGDAAFLGFASVVTAQRRYPGLKLRRRPRRK